MNINRTAPAPTRATSTLVVTAGLMNVTCSAYTGIENTGVIRHERFQGNPDIPVTRTSTRGDTGEAVDRADVVRMAQADDGTWVPLDDAEMVAAADLPTGGCEVVTFVPVKDAGQYLTDGLYQVRPKIDKKGGPAATAAFALLTAGMKARKVHALVRVALRGTPRYGLLTADGDLLMIATADSIRASLPMPEYKPTKAEVTMVTSLIDAIGVGTPTVVDDVAPKVRAYVNTKAASGAPATPKLAPVVDLTAVLEASIKAAKAAG